MKRLEILIPGDPLTPTGGYGYDRRMVLGLRRLGWRVRVHRLDGGFPSPTRRALDRAREVLARIPSGARVLIDGLAMGAMPSVVAREARRLRLIALVHHPLAEETGLSRRREAAYRDSERQALASARRVIVTSRHTAALVTRLGVPGGRIWVVEPGTDPAPLARGSETATAQLLCVATLTPRKGHAVLFDALSGIADRDWHLICVGSLDRDPLLVARLRRQLARLGLTDRVGLAGAVDRAALAAHYHGADLLVSATRFEGYGMVFTEALARGLPVVATRAGAVATTVPEPAGLLVPPNDREALTAALARVLDDPALRGRLAAGAREARAGLPTWEVACVRMAAALRGLPG